ncbi:hypothetical protein M885DRAFT_570763 [Pelagophyceae sp. CCMP2097]|nr:hypothetical protein M885DRAFT_570763 [Pelagophyceae sp. CCMP2097]
MAPNRDSDKTIVTIAHELQPLIDTEAVGPEFRIVRCTVVLVFVLILLFLVRLVLLRLLGATTASSNCALGEQAELPLL